MNVRPVMFKSPALSTRAIAMRTSAVALEGEHPALRAVIAAPGAARRHVLDDDHGSCISTSNIDFYIAFATESVP
jgi:hypothetical protein